MGRNIKEEEFLRDLNRVLSKHNVIIKEVEEYDGNEEYCGSSYVFRDNDRLINISVSELSQE